MEEPSAMETLGVTERVPVPCLIEMGRRGSAHSLPDRVTFEGAIPWFGRHSNLGKVLPQTRAA